MGFMNGWAGSLITLAVIAIPVAALVWFMRRPAGGRAFDDSPSADHDAVAEQGEALGPTGRVRPK